MPEPRDPLDLSALAPFLADALGMQTERLDVHQFASGFSNLTYRLDDGQRQVVLRRPPTGPHVRGGHDMGREFRLLRALHGRVPVPRPLAFEPTGSLLGAPFYVMEHVPGTILRASGTPPASAVMAGVARAFVQTFADLHAVDVEAAGLSEMGQPAGYVERQVSGWQRRYHDAATDAIPAVERAFEWMQANRPPESAAALVHNDYKYDNIVLRPERLGDVRAVLDWELATVGDPLMDLGSSLGYWVEADDPPALRAAALSPTWWPGNPTRAGLVEAYEQATGRQVEHAVFYAAYGFTKLAGIAQQIYARHTLGQTSDPRFAGLIHVVRACGDAAVRAIETGRV